MRLKMAFVGFVVIISFVVAGVAIAKPPTSLSNLLGTWYNTQPTSGGVVKIIVTLDAGLLKVHAYGKCTPTPCDWGTVTASPFSRSVSSGVAYGFDATYVPGFAETVITAVRKFDLDGGSYLEVQTRTKFVAGDTRYDYERIEMFRK
jgi:hypothetical protein